MTVIVDTNRLQSEEPQSSWSGRRATTILHGDVPIEVEGLAAALW